MAEQQYIKALIYGIHGGGKTRFTADAPKPQWYDFENSTQTLRHWSEYEHLAKSAIMYPEPLQLFNHIRQCVRDPEIETIVIDSISSGSDAYFIDHMEKEKAAHPKRDEFVRFDSDYGPGTNVWVKILTRLQTAKINVVIIGHQREDRSNDRDGTVTSIYPDLTPAIRRAALRLVDFVGYMEISKPASRTSSVERRMYVNPTHLIAAKNRFNIQETFIDNPTWDGVFNRAN